MKRALVTLLFASLVHACGGGAASTTTSVVVVSAPTATCDTSGEWLGRGMADDGASYTFPMHVRQSGASVDVTIEWYGAEGALGPEEARGTVDCEGGTMSLQTVALSEGLVPGRYTIVLDPNGRAMQGEWRISGQSGGRFTAERR
jgi:hypothetical protein